MQDELNTKSEIGIVYIRRTNRVDESGISIFEFSGNCFDRPLEVHGESVVEEVINNLIQKYSLKLFATRYNGAIWNAKFFEYQI